MLTPKVGFPVLLTFSVQIGQFCRPFMEDIFIPQIANPHILSSTIQSFKFYCMLVGYVKAMTSTPTSVTSREVHGDSSRLAGVPAPLPSCPGPFLTCTVDPRAQTQDVRAGRGLKDHPKHPVPDAIVVEGGGLS